MSGADFPDSNVLVYVVDNASSAKQAVARRLIDDAHLHRSTIISFQVVQETLHVLTRKFRVVVQPADALAFLRDVLAPLRQVHPSPALCARALAVRQRWRFAFHDSRVVAAALATGCARLLSEGLQHGRQIDGLRIENPFLSSPA